MFKKFLLGWIGGILLEGILVEALQNVDIFVLTPIGEEYTFER